MEGFETIYQAPPVTPTGYQAPPVMPAETPSRRGLVIAIVVGVVLIGALVAGFFLWRASRQQAVQRVTEIENRISQAEQTCATAANPEACRANEILKIAQETGQGDLCAQLEGPDRDLCVNRDAQQKADENRCQGLSTEELKKSCIDVIRMTKAQASGDASLCAAISDASIAETCRATIEWALTSELCRVQGRDAALCDAITQREAAVAAGDFTLCAGISLEEQRGMCEEVVGGLDVDHDGLTAREEAEYKTNPTNPDTDGDSYPDGVEVQGGYNPNGPGRL